MIKKWAFALLFFAAARPAWAAIEMSAWMSYQTQHEETLDLYGKNFTSVSVFAYDFDTNDNIGPAAPWVVSELSTLMQNKIPGRPVFITIVNDIESNPPQQHNGDLVYRILSNSTKRAQHIQQIVALSAKADGIDIDYESLLSGTRPYFSQFIQELRAALPAGKLLSVDCQPKTDTADGPRGQAIDWKTIAPHVDIMKILTYYYSYGGSPPGPSAPLDKILAVTNLAKSEIPPQKLHIVLTQFGWDWPNGGQGEFLSYEEAIQIAQTYGVTPFRDSTSKTLRINYTDTNGTPHQIWVPDNTALQAQMSVIQNAGVSKIDVWELGRGDTNFWDWVADNTVNPNGGGNPSPVLSSLIPSSATTGSSGFTLKVAGSRFINGSVVRWNGADRTTTFVSSVALTAAIPADDVASAGISTVTVFNPAPGGGTSGGRVFTVVAPNPAPTLSSLNPSSATAGGSAFTLTLTGSHFIANSVVQWNGASRATTFVSATQLTAAISAGDIASAAVSSVTVSNPAPGGGTSAIRLFTVKDPNPVPTLSSLNPDSTTAGSSAFTLTVTGSNFVADSVVQWNGSSRSTTFVSSTRLTASIPAGDIAAVDTSTITVFNPAPGGGTSGGRVFTVVAPNPAPTLSSLNPSSATAGGSAFTLTLTGSHFIANSVVQWNGANRATTFVSATQLTAAISAGDIASAAVSSVTVSNPAPGGGTSAIRLFTVKDPNPVPTLSSLNPDSTTAGSSAFTLTVTGSNFVADSVVQWNGSSRSTTFVSSTRLTASIPAGDVAAVDTSTITVFNPAPGGGTSGVQFFTVVGVNPVPSLSTLAPSSASTGGSAFTMTLTGSNFIDESVVRMNGVDRPTTFVSSTQLKATIPSADSASARISSVTVFNPAPGGGTSGIQTFTVEDPNPSPALSSIAPSSGTAGDPAFTMTVTGSNFIAGSIVQWNGAGRATKFVSATQLTASITASDIIGVGTFDVTVFNPAPGGGVSGAKVFTVGGVNPAPTLATLNPSSAAVGSAAFTLTLAGSNFVDGSIVRWNGADRATAFVSATQLTASISENDVGAVSTASVAVFNPAPGGGLSSAKAFVIYDQPVPRIAALDPPSIDAGSSGFLLIIEGAHFSNGTVAEWNGTTKPTIYISSSQVKAEISAADVASPGTFRVMVIGPGSVNSNSRMFTVGGSAQQNGSQMSDLTQVRVFPNPWVSSRANGAPITFDQLTPGSTIKIFTLAGQWIRSVDAPQGNGVWDLTNDAHERVATDYYLFLITDSQGHKAKGKLAVIK